ncbi:MAG: InlB B-repeat-containing protein, partial [Paludibacteraceae bacterium]|nr:InlB B-repeat-containing protein [Paludibacteraceae bacterium]
MYIRIEETETYNDGNGGTFQGPRVNEDGYEIWTPWLMYSNYYYMVDDGHPDEYVVGYAREKGSNGYGRCNQSSYYYGGNGGTNSFSMFSINAGRVVVKKGKDGTMFLIDYSNSGGIRCIIGEEDVDDGVITATSDNLSQGKVTGSVVGTDATFVSGNTYDGGTQITLNANAESDYAFLQWNDGNTDNPRTITVNGDADYTAYFAAAHTITGLTNNASWGTVAGGGTYAEGASVTLTPNPESGYRFVEWDDHSTANPRTITVGNADAEYTAIFEENGIIDIYIPNASAYKPSGYYNITGTSGIYDFKFETNGKIFPTSLSTRTYSSSEINADNSWLKENGINIALSSRNVTMRKVHNLSTESEYYLYAEYIATDGREFHIHATYLNNPISDDDTYGINWNFNISEVTHDKTIIDSKDVIILDAKRSFYEGGYNKDREVIFRFVVGAASYIGGYITSGNYIVSSGNDGVDSYLLRGYDWGGTVGKSVIHGTYQDFKYYYYLVLGSSRVINPNLTQVPMYVGVSGKNTQGYDLTPSIGTEPSLSLVTFTSSDGNGNTASFTCAEGHGYTSSGIDSEETGNYYYNGTKLYLSATVADPANYRFKGWNIGGTLYTDVAQTDYEYTVSEAVTIQAVFERIYAVTITQPAIGTLTVKNGNTTINSGDKIGEDTKLTVTYSGNGYDAAISPTLDGNNQFTVSAATTVSAVLTAHTYTITYGGLNGETNTNPDTYTIESEDINLVAPGTRDGYIFAGWTDESDNTITQITTGSTGNRTLTATWNAATTLDLYDNQDATYYNNIKALNGQTYDVTYHRSVKYESDNGNARWYTLCLPFDVDQSQLTNAGLLRKVYEYRYATGSADVGDQVTFHFRVATSMVAGQGYLVKATGDMGPDFTFENVTLNTSADVENGNVDNLKNSNAYKESGDIAIVGVLRSGTLSAVGKQVMGLANNKIWYPHSSGNPMPAYRAYFYNPNASASVMPRVRIVVEGEGATELEVVDGELISATEDSCAPSKYIRNGVLIIE